MAKIAIIVQRYGLEVNGGAEYHARLLAEQLVKKHDVTILTTKASDYVTWDNYYKLSNEVINNVKVKRFKTDHPRLFNKIDRSRKTILKDRKHQRSLKKNKLINWLDNKTSILDPTNRQGYKWLKAQGPFCPSLLDYIKANKNDYDSFIFFTYLYYPSALGIKLVKNKSIFIPTAHNEPEFFSKIYQKVFKSASFIMYNTIAEKKLVEKNIKGISLNSDIAGIGVDNKLITETISHNFSKHNDFLLYVGRIDTNKGCGALYDDFLKFKLNHPSNNLKLIFVGKNHTDLQPTEDIIFTGFVSEEVKYDLMKKSTAVILPSKFESLSMVTLEAMNLGKIMLVNEKCEVLKDHIVNSKSGFFYKDSNEFILSINKILQLTEKETQAHSKNATEYIRNNYTWERIVNKFDKAIQFIIENNK